jgi:hypothetical protein
MQIVTDDFYARLPANKIPLGDLLAKNELFCPIPADWHVIITDIKSSTHAVMSGRHEDVNLVATGSIVAVLNIAFGMNVTVPFFFGGDGATFIVPPGIITPVMQALTLYKTNTLDNFKLELRTGTIPVKEIYAKGYSLNIAKFSSTEVFYIPILLGNGLNYAEQLVKGPDYLMAPQGTAEEELDLTGMQCRWDKIPPPENKEEVVTLLVVATEGTEQAVAFRKIMTHMDEIYGSPQKRQPISIAKLKLKTTFNRLGAEMRARIGKVPLFELIRTWFINLYGYIYFSTERGKTYLKALVEMSDTLVIDGKINTVISGSAKQRASLQMVLDEMEQAGDIIYGLHISSASIMSCYVRDLKDSHIHFVDGAEGGYTQAAKILKAKLH